MVDRSSLWSVRVVSRQLYTVPEEEDWYLKKTNRSKRCI